MSHSVSCQLNITNQRGLHARASAKFVKLSESFAAKIVVSRDGECVNAASIMGLMMLGASLGMTIEVSASGPDADQALAAITDLVERKFDEE
ncbi:HPr family phosphocarrier protein [Alphaproteobacteria bacterium]|nr:HPr family phosphocarrier protein [Alphaproteobacteria bacterium]MDC0148066.1 HPr family phosphocarrier protein [Alphaproteobacteria bacterium]